MFKENGVNFFPIYSSKEKLEKMYSLKMIMPEFIRFEGVLFASQLNNSMIYIIDYKQDDEIVIFGDHIKKIMKNNFFHS